MLSWNFGDVGLRIFAMPPDNDNDLFLILRYIFHSSCWLASLVLFYQFHYSIVFFHKASIYHPFWKRVYSSGSKDQNILHQVPIVFLFVLTAPTCRPASILGSLRPFSMQQPRWPLQNPNPNRPLRVCPGPSTMGPFPVSQSPFGISSISVTLCSSSLSLLSFWNVPCYFPCPMTFAYDVLLKFIAQSETKKILKPLKPRQPQNE